MSDVWFNFKAQIGEDIFEEAKLSLRTILAVITESKKEGGEYANVVKKLNKAFVSMFEKAVMGAGNLAISAGQALDIMLEMKV